MFGFGFGLRNKTCTYFSLKAAHKFSSTKCATPTYTIGLEFHEYFIHEMFTSYQSTEVSHYMVCIRAVVSDYNV